MTGELISKAYDVLRDGFGYEEFREGQRDIIEKLLRGQNVLAVMPTGAGKSLCYQIPAYVSDRLTIVVSPLVSLIEDQVAALKSCGLNVACLHSGKDREANVAEWRAVASGEVKLLYMSPERLMTDRMIGALQKLEPAMFIVDEAHCISKWGTNFRPDYAALSHIKTCFPDAVVAGFTATADLATQNDIADMLFAGRGEIIVHGFDRPNLTLSVEPKVSWKKQLLSFLSDRSGQSGIVYCLSRKSTEQVAEFLTENGHRALPYHAGMATDLRRKNQELFMAGEVEVMVATIAFGMGIDKPDVRYVFHMNLPGSFEAYYQEIGRAGRDGFPAQAHMIFGLDDIRNRRMFIDQDGEDDAHKRREHKRLDALLAYCESVECRRRALLSYFGEEHENCGNCDVCINPPITEDRTAEASVLLQAILQTGRRFGAQHVIAVVCGDNTQKIREFSHDSLPTYGQGADMKRPFWQSLVRQAVASGFLSIEIDRYGALDVTPRGMALLEGKDTLKYREVAVQKKALKKTSALNVQDCSDPDLFMKLKAVRKELASELDVPAYVVFPDQTLLNMVEMKPVSLEEMLDISGVGPKKLENFGETFLTVLTEA